MAHGIRTRRRLSRLRLSIALLAILAAIGAGLPARHAAAQEWRGLANDNIDIEYAVPISPANWATYALLEKRQVLEELSAFLSPLRLPYRLTIRTEECLAPNAFYGRHVVRICYELPAHASTVAFGMIRRGFTRDDVIVGTFVLATLHEIGHAVFDMYRVPMFGREEDAADQIAALVLLNFGTDAARRSIVGYAQYARALDSPLARTGFADEHGTHMQRFYNLLCIAYGAQPDTFKDVVATGILPAERAVQCGREYEQVRSAFAQTIWPHIDQGRLNKVRAITWARWEGAGIDDLLTDFRFRLALALSALAALLLYASSTSPKAFVAILARFDRGAFRGRTTRLQWWTCTISLMAADNLVYSLLFFADRFAWPFGIQVVFVASSYALYATLYWYAMFGITRLHDRNRPGWLVVFWFAPWAIYVATTTLQRIAPDLVQQMALPIGLAALLSGGLWIWTFVGLGLRRGTPGTNRFGPENRSPPPRNSVGELAGAH
jgi:uncharacterized membrane protein YhaH (DUF805 family)